MNNEPLENPVDMNSKRYYYHTKHSIKPRVPRSLSKAVRKKKKEKKNRSYSVLSDNINSYKQVLSSINLGNSQYQTPIPTKDLLN